MLLKALFHDLCCRATSMAGAEGPSCDIYRHCSHYSSKYVVRADRLGTASSALAWTGICLLANPVHSQLTPREQVHLEVYHFWHIRQSHPQARPCPRSSRVSRRCPSQQTGTPTTLLRPDGHPGPAAAAQGMSKGSTHLGVQGELLSAM